MSKTADSGIERQQLTAIVCATKLCWDGKPHDGKAIVKLYDDNGRVSGVSVACSRCGSAAIDRDLLEAP